VSGASPTRSRDALLRRESKDTDFRERSFVEGFPPKVVWLDVGNAGTQLIAQLLERERDRVERFASANDVSLLILSLDSRAI
jgi:predicted nuclease of predicted toxin-antitoxin system